jgi:phenylacetate-CoA ligase
MFINLKNNILEKAILPFGDLLTRQQVMERYKFYSTAQKWDDEQISVYRNEKFKETVRIASTETAFYKELYNTAGVNINNIRTASDLKYLPIVTKSMLKQAYPEKCTRNSGRPWVELYTSGSSGAPFCVRQDSFTLSESRALMLLRATFSGWQIGDKYFQTGMTLKRGFIKKMKDLALGITYISAFNLTNSMLDIYLEMLDSKKINFLMGYASSLYCLAVRAEEIAFNRNLKGIVSWGDNLYEHYRSKIEKQFKCIVTDTYGCGEGIQISAQCQKGNYHIFSPHVIVEFVDTVSKKKVSSTERGQILLTRLHPGAMPLIRYEVGDIGIKGKELKCNCGCNFEIMQSIEGRDADIVQTVNGNKLIVHFFTGIMEYEITVKNFLIIQENIEGIRIKIVPGEGFSKDVLNRIEKEIHEKGDRDLLINFEIVDDIKEIVPGKRKFIISNLEKEKNL